MNSKSDTNSVTRRGFIRLCGMAAAAGGALGAAPAIAAAGWFAPYTVRRWKDGSTGRGYGWIDDFRMLQPGRGHDQGAR